MRRFLKYHSNLFFLLTSLLIVIAFSLYLRFTVKGYYETGISLMKTGHYQEAEECFEKIGDYKNSIKLLSNVKTFIKYKDAKDLFNNSQFEAAADIFLELDGFANSHEWYLKSKYAQARQLFNERDYTTAAQVFLSLEGYSDSNDWYLKTKYTQAIQMYDEGDYATAAQMFLSLGDYEKSEQYAAKTILPEMEKMQEIIYNEALSLFDSQKYEDAIVEFSRLGDYKDSIQYIKSCEDMISRLNHAKQIAAGAKTVIGIKNDHTLATSGEISIYNFSTFSDLVSVDVGERIAVGLKRDGTVVITGDTSAYTKPNDWDDIVAISAGGNYIIGLRDDGTVLSQGHNGDKQCNVEGWKDVISIATGWRHTVGLTKDGEILVTGFASEKLRKEIASAYSDWADVVAIDAGGGGTDLRGHIVGLKPDGTVVAVGDNTYGQCEVSGWTDIVMIAAGDWHTVGLKADGTVVSTMPDPAKEFKGLDGETPLVTSCCNVNDLTDVISISAGTGITVALKSDGTATVIGFNDYKQREGAKAWHNMWIIPAIR